MKYEPHKLARNTDPDTSHAAAGSIEIMRQHHADIIMNALHTPRTAHEIAQNCSLDYIQVNRRLPELESNNLVEKTSERRKNPSGRTAVVWRKQ